MPLLELILLLRQLPELASEIIGLIQNPNDPTPDEIAALESKVAASTAARNQVIAEAEAELAAKAPPPAINP